MKLTIPNLEKANVLIVGDVILDRYWYGNTNRISPEAPVPITHVEQTKDKAGGAGNVALNTYALGCNTTLIGVCGNDANGKLLEDYLKKKGIHCKFKRYDAFPTISKVRIVSQQQQLLRLDFENPHSINSNDILPGYQQCIAQTNVVILSDYAKGLLHDPQPYIKLANKHNIPVLVDPKTSDFTIYSGATLATPNFKEFTNAVGPCASEQDIINKGLNLIKQCKFTALLITRGKDGMTLLRKDKPPFNLPTQAKEVFDVTGAGDTVIATLGACLAAGSDIEQAVILANLAAGITITKLGAGTVTPAELRRHWETSHQADHLIMNEERIIQAIEDARMHNETIVMTNGCFDLIHAGHIAYLEEAKRLGDRLIVAVNDDNSVKRLKGNQRPLNSLANRMKVLVGLSAVDWVIPFSDDTPERLINHLLPDVLVKGGDYKSIDHIAGSQAVIANGGSVKILKYIEGCSTTAIIKKIQKEGE